MRLLRQAMNVSIKELRDLADELEKQNNELKKEISSKVRVDKRWLVTIINKSPNCSDTWRFEK